MPNTAWKLKKMDPGGGASKILLCRSATCRESYETGHLIDTWRQMRVGDNHVNVSIHSVSPLPIGVRV